MHDATRESLRLMTIRFAPARNCIIFRSVVFRRNRVAGAGFPDNDNEEVPVSANDDALLHDTLRHFARFGMSAAANARDQAHAAIADGDRVAHEKWISVCRMLDPRMAARATRATLPQD